MELIGIGHISSLRKNYCSSFEIFCAMIIRAYMCKEENVYIKMPFEIDTSLDDIKKIFDKINILDNFIKKNIYILDIKANQYRYEGKI